MGNICFIHHITDNTDLELSKYNNDLEVLMTCILWAPRVLKWQILKQVTTLDLKQKQQ